jgi:hypothetical protein
MYLDFLGTGMWADFTYKLTLSTWSHVVLLCATSLTDSRDRRDDTLPGSTARSGNNDCTYLLTNRCPYNSPPYSSPPYNSSPYSSPPLHLATFQLATITSRHYDNSPPLHLATITFRHHYISPVLYTL